MDIASNRISETYIRFAPIVAGTLLACALSAVLLQFGTALGFTTTQALKYSGENISWRLIVVGMWLFWVQLLASLIGGYIAGRTRERFVGGNAHESEMRDGIHGLLVWATSTVIMVIAVTVGSFLTTFAAQHGVDVPLDTHVSEAMARKSGIILGFSLAAGSLVSAIVAWWTGTLGGEHRDEATDFSHIISFRNRRKR